jgi:hypothetical protein
MYRQSSDQRIGPLAVFAIYEIRKQQDGLFSRAWQEGLQRLLREFAGIGRIGNSKCHVGILRAHDHVRTAVVDDLPAR